MAYTHQVSRRVYITKVTTYKIYKIPGVNILFLLTAFIFFIPQNNFAQCTDKRRYIDEIQTIANIGKKVSSKQLITLLNIQKEIIYCPGSDSLRIFLFQKIGNAYS